MVKIDDRELTAIVGIAVFITFMVENLVNRSVVVANETDMNLLKALATPPPASVFIGMAVVTVIFSIIAAHLSDEMVDRVVASSSYVGSER